MSIDLAVLIPQRDQTLAAGVFAVAAIPGFDHHFVGRDGDGRACLLLGSTDSGVRAPVRLGGLDVQYALSCMVRIGGVDDQRVLTVCTSTTRSAEAERYFLHVMTALLQLVGDAPSLSVLAEAITELAGIFQRLSSRPKESVIGIIGELVLIANASDPPAAALAWRIDPDERYDFTAGDLRLEVKSSGTRRRVHSFSYEQCDVPGGCCGIVASTFIERGAGGMSVEDLLGVISRRLIKSPNAMFHVERTLAATLGAELPSALTFSFDFALASAELSFFDLFEVPAIRGPLHPSVTQVRFASDLSAISASDVELISRQCPDFIRFKPHSSERGPAFPTCPKNAD